MNNKLVSYPDSIENMGSKFETMTLVDRLIEENLALKRQLNLKTGQLRELQHAVHTFLMNPNPHTQDGLAQRSGQENAA